MGNMSHSYRCQICGIIMVNVGYGRKYCDDCRQMKIRENKTKWEGIRRNKLYEPRGCAEKYSPLSDNTIRQHAEKRAAKSDELLLEKCRVADWLGISYGKLMLKGTDKVAELTRQYYEAMKTA